MSLIFCELRYIDKLSEIDFMQLFFGRFNEIVFWRPLEAPPPPMDNPRSATEWESSFTYVALSPVSLGLLASMYM